MQINDNYLDIANKFIYYKEKIINDFIKKGIYPDNKLINSKLKNIDLNLALFKNYNIKSGEKFNTNEYNENLKLIYLDLKYLYDILEKLAINEFNNLQMYINSYINELNTIVNTYKKKADYENNSTTLGETILFQDNNFTIDNEDSTTIIELDTISLKKGSEIACIANINNIDLDNVIFSFNDGEFSCCPYNSSFQSFIVPGEKTINEYDYVLQQAVSSNNIIINIDAEINNKNDYNILCGKDLISITDKNNKYITQKITNDSKVILFKEKSSVNFYILNGDNVSFKFSKKPINCNFSLEDNTITNLKTIQNFHIEVDEDTTLEIELGKGNIYAISEAGIVNNNKLYYTGLNISNDYHIIETIPGEEVDYNLKLKILNDNNNSAEIQSIIIKNLD